MKTFYTAILMLLVTIPASAHATKLQYLTNPTDDIVVTIGDKPRPSGQVVVLTDSHIHQRYNIHSQRNVYVVCRRDVFEVNNHKPCHMVVIIGDQIIEEIDGHPSVHRNPYGSAWRL